MKKILMLLMLAIFTTPMFAQTLDEINTLMVIRQFDKAKTNIDKYLAVPKNAEKADGWYFKGRIYNSLSYDSGVAKKDVYNLKMTALEAFKKYQALDPKDKRMIEEEHRSYLDLYYGIYDLGAAFFNQKDYEASFNAFKEALEVRDYIMAKKYIYQDAPLVAFDTSLVMNTAIAATQAKRDADAITYYRKIVDAGIAGENNLEIYQFLVDTYSKAKDEANLKLMLEKSRAAYPTNDFWDEVELNEIVRNPDDKTPLFAKYEELTTRNTKSYNLAYNYGVEYYNSIYGKDAKPADIPAAQAKLTTILKQAIANDKGYDATMLMTNHLYNIAAEFSSKASLIKGVKPEDVKKKNELKKESNTYMDEMIVYAESVLKHIAALPTKKGIDKANEKITLGYLIEVYGVKGDTKKVVEYEKFRDSLPN